VLHYKHKLEQKINKRRFMDNQNAQNPGMNGQPQAPMQPMQAQPNSGYAPVAQQPKNGLAIAGLVCGIIAMFLPIPFIDIVIGVTGIILAIVAKKQCSTGWFVAALIVSIIGTINSIIFSLFMGIILGGTLGSL
jgi:hypothetical protein